MSSAQSEIIVRSPARPLDERTMERLREGLASCPDVAFAHLVDVLVPERGPTADLALFVWLVPAAVRSLRGALNLVSETVARALPRDTYVDVLILNSVPELLADVEAAQCLLVERDAEERRRALAASEVEEEGARTARRRRGLWPF